MRTRGGMHGGVIVLVPLLLLACSVIARTQTPQESAPSDRAASREELAPKFTERRSLPRPRSTDTGSMDDRVAAFKQSLESTGREVDEGLFSIIDAEYCSNVPVCFYNNPTSPYGRLVFPLAPGEPDPDPQNRRGMPPELEHLYSAWRLQPDEAVVWIGRTPPESSYFSFTAYVFNRSNPKARRDPPYGGRLTLFASLGESENQATMKTSAEPGESAFDQESVLIVTADRNVDIAIRDQLVQAGFPHSEMNTLVLPLFKADGVTPKIFMGYEDDADNFTVLMRIADTDAVVPGTPLRTWLDSPESRIFRVRAGGALPLDPFPLPALRSHGTGTSESRTSLLELVRRIERRHSDRDTETRIAWPLEAANGDFCLDHLSPCNGDCRDTPYMAATSRLGEAPEAIIVAGRNHEASGKAAYANITATRVAGKTAFYSVVMDDLEGSARAFMPFHEDADNLWQVKFARECHREPFCYELTEDQIPIGGLVAILVRAYLDPATGTSAKVFPIDESELVFPRVIKIH